MTLRNTILEGDALACLKDLATSTVDTVLTSPPFFMQRNYGVPGQMGLEPTVEEWVKGLRAVMAEVARVVAPTGSVWIDLGDSYSRHPRYGAVAKSMLLAPERLALALVEDGWILRNKVIWAKTNPMPTSVGDRLTNTYDVVFHFVRSRRYYYDLDAVRMPHTSGAARPSGSVPDRRPDWAGPLAGSNAGLHRARLAGVPGHLLGKNPGDVWRLSTASYRGAHFATFPESLMERPLLATCPPKVCEDCDRPWRHSPGNTYLLGERHPAGKDTHVRRYPDHWRVLRQRGPLAPDCTCEAPSRPGLVLDPFFGTGTIGALARRHGRDWLGIELNPEYADLARERLGIHSSNASERAA